MRTLLVVLGYVATALLACGITAMLAATRMAELRLENGILRDWVHMHGGFTGGSATDGE